MAKTVKITSPIKVLTSGKVPTSSNLPNGNIAVGKVGKYNRVYANVNGNIADTLQYESAEAEGVATVQALGGIAAGTKASDLKGKPVSEILDTLLFPVVQPTAVAPSASVSYGKSLLVEVGSTAPASNDFTHTFNKGEIRIAGVKKQDRSGDATAYVVQASTNGASYANILPDVFTTMGTVKYRVNVTYAAGPTPLDSKGNPATSLSALAAGSVNSNEITVNVLYPYFANSSTAGELTKQPLITTTSLVVSCVSETSEGRHTFALPASFTVTKVEYFDTVANAYKPMNVSDFTASEYSQTVQGKSVAYKKYVRNTEGLSAKTQFRITFTKA